MVSGISQASQMATQLFSRIDTKSQGYIEKSDLASAFSQISSSSTSSSGSASSSASASVDDVFSALDSNSDGKVTKDEFASVLAQLQEQMDSQRVQGGEQGGGQGGPQGAGGRPPPPPPGNDSGFTEDELSSQLDAIGSSDAQASSMISTIISNFEAADSDGDGKVSFAEAQAYDQSSKTATAIDSTGSTSSVSGASSSNTEAGVMMKIMQLMHAYGSGQESGQSSISNLLSATA